jgi:two-component system LytT family sensor kinase
MRSISKNTEPFYKKNFMIRHVIIVIMAIFFAETSLFSLNSYSPMVFFKAFISNFTLIATIWNSNVWVMNYISLKYSWEKDLKLKISLFSLFAILLPIIIHVVFDLFVFPFINGRECLLTSKESFSYLIVSVAITLLINAIMIAVDFFRFWKISLTEKEELKRTSLSAEFEALKNQVSPHFLFNSLNTLSSLIDENPKQANEFVQKLASVYRYVLTHRDKETVLLHEEIDFVKAYIFLNKIRFGINLNTSIDIDATCIGKNIPTLTIQMLIENAIKHNVISAQKPLYIAISCLNDYLTVENNLQAKLTTNESNGIGLSNIVERYNYLTDKKVLINKSETKFSVSVPLI